MNRNVEIIDTKKTLCQFLGIAERTFYEWKRFSDVKGRRGLFTPEDRNNLAVFWVSTCLLGIERKEYHHNVVPRATSVVLGQQICDHLVALQAYLNDTYGVTLDRQIEAKLTENALKMRNRDPLNHVLERLHES
jgi:hypothetical protein